MKKVILPNKGNLRVAWYLAGSLIGLMIFADLWIRTFALTVLSVFPLGFVLIAYVFIKGQRIELTDEAISHRRWCFYKFVTKTFKYEDIAYWRTEFLTLVVLKKGGTEPKLPHGLFADLSHVLLIPASLFAPETTKVTDALLAKGIKEKING